MTDNRPSEEILNAFVDGEFSRDDRLNTLRMIASDESLSREVCDMVRLKELISSAYRVEDMTPTPERACAVSRWSGGVSRWFLAAASLGVLALAGLLFWSSAVETRETGWVEVAPVPAPVTLSSISRDAHQVLLHVTETASAEAPGLFDEIEYLFSTASLRGQGLQVQLVVHGLALDLVRADLSPIAERVTGLLERHPSLRITACDQSLARAERIEGQPVELLPGVERVESGVLEAARRQSLGWTYIRV
jgi:uncharacterized protein